MGMISLPTGTKIGSWGVTKKKLIYYIHNIQLWMYYSTQADKQCICEMNISVKMG